MPKYSGMDICSLSARAMAAEIRAGRLSAREALDAHLARIAAVNPKVNAIVTLVPERACMQARDADEKQARGESLAPLHGLPIAHKDLQDTAGVRTTYGSLLFKEHFPLQDSPLVERIRRAGTIMVGKTNTPEFGAGSQTYNVVFGATRNPWDLSKTCGGSSGGAAVALACGMVPLADGSDLGGSLRNPASFCNVVGFRGSVELGPQTASPWFSLAVEGPMARTVDDTAFFLSAIQDSAPRLLDRDFRGLRIAWYRDLGGIPFDRRVRSAVDSKRRAFEALGCTVEEAEPDFSGADEVFKTMRALLYQFNLGALTHEQRKLVKAPVLEEIQRGEKLRGPDVARAESLRLALLERARVFFQKHDYFVLPVSQVPPFPVEQQWITEIEGVRMESYLEWMRSCYYISVLGYPSLAMPAGFTSEGLPVGLQIVGKHRDDWGVLQIGHALEIAQPTVSAPLL